MAGGWEQRHQLHKQGTSTAQGVKSSKCARGRQLLSHPCEQPKQQGQDGSEAQALCQALSSGV